MVVNDTEKESSSSHDSIECPPSQREPAGEIPIFKWVIWNFEYVGEFGINSRQVSKMGSLVEFCQNLEKEATNWQEHPSPLQTTLFL